MSTNYDRDPQRLFERTFKGNAEFHGDELVKKDATAAKRVAAELTNTVNNWRFHDLLEAEQQLALKAATQTMLRLARTLDEVRVLSKRHFKQCEAARQAEAARRKAAREAELDAMASARWADDTQMKSEANDLAEFFKVGEAWLARARGVVGASVLLTPEVDSGFSNDSELRLPSFIASCRAEPTVAVTLALRRYTAATVDALAKERRPSYRYSTLRGGEAEWQYARLADFEAWRAEHADRKRVVALATGAAA